MSYIPSYQGPTTPAPPRRPTSVTVLAILGIILGALGLCGMVSNLVQLVIKTNPVLVQMDRSPVMHIWSPVSIVLGLGLTIALLAGSIGMLSLQTWARQMVLIYAVASLVLGVLGTIISAIWMIPIFNQLASDPDPAVRMGGVVGKYSLFISPVIGAIYPVFVLVFLRRRNVVEAFEPQPPPPPLAPPVG